MKPADEKDLIRSKYLWIAIAVAGACLFLGDTFARLAGETTWIRPIVEWASASIGYMAEGVRESTQGGLLWIFLFLGALGMLLFWGLISSDHRRTVPPDLPDSLRDHEHSCIMDGLEARAVLGAADAESAEGICVNCLQVETLCACTPCEECGSPLATRPVPNAPPHMRKVFGIFASPHQKPVLTCQECFWKNHFTNPNPIHAKVI